ncbi:hypothetical protein AM587_10002221 [Phytophthora nicotianae]|uniref:Uncharacterized protein n=2 Tax=Phytophthora nicotianae TaxID=4792 RepID=A0A0W8CD74_PHYNI|nr:hypothetical protein AM587_10002221 [Phytophthora nicotianae]
MDSDERRRLIQEAISRCTFPPSIVYPEASNRNDDMAPLSKLFRRPLVVWVPECLNGGKAECISPKCLCTPRVKEYVQRTVGAVDCKCELLYTRYECTSTGTCFTTASSSYLNRRVDTIVHFPFVLSVKSGISKEFMEIVHDGVMSPNGLSSALTCIRRRRQTRYYKLYTLFADRIRRIRNGNTEYVAPTPPSCSQYCSDNAPPTSNSLTAQWLEWTSIYSSLCEVLMQHLKVRRALRIDHSVKFCMKLKNWTGSGQREGIADGKMLLLAQNEIGQIIGRRLTRSENNEETEELLRSVAHSFQPATSNGDLFVVSDDASSVRNMVHRVFQDRVSTKQDPFHVIQRITTKVKVAKRKWIAKELKAAIYTVDREMRPTQEMESAFRHVVERLSLDDVSCSVSEWRGCYESNLGQIRRGDLFVQESVYKEGGKAVRVVSTSQLEGFHSALKKLVVRQVSAALGLRILDVFIVRHNLRVGAEFGRNVNVGDLDFISLSHAALLSHGAVAESPQLEFALNMISRWTNGFEFLKALE